VLFVHFYYGYKIIIQYTEAVTSIQKYVVLKSVKNVGLNGKRNDMW